MLFKDFISLWIKVAANSFGGPAGQIAVIHELVVDKEKIISEERFLHALNFCMLLPGPEAQQLATYLGWVMRGWRGGLIAGGLFILPGFLSILTLSYIYVLYKDLSFVQALFYGIKPAIIAIVFGALIKISSRALTSSFYYFIALSSFAAIFFFSASFPLIVLVSALLGLVHGFFMVKENNNEEPSEESISILGTFKTFFIWLSLWLLPLATLFFAWGKSSSFFQISLFFSKMSLVTFGGAYAALSYVAQQAVDIYGWLAGSEMLDGLAFAESTPGPLIQVVQFVGFMGAYRFPDGMNPYLSAFIGSVLTTWMTFIPCFLFIFTLAPYVEFLRGKKFLTMSLKAITASVVGVILNLSIWFAIESLFAETQEIQHSFLDFSYPLIRSIDFYALSICLSALYLQFYLKKGLFTIIGVSVLLGLIFH